MSAVQTDLEDPEFLGRVQQPTTDVLIVSNRHLAPLMARAASVASRNSVVPVLGHVLLQSSPLGLTVSANNLEMALRQSCAAEGPLKSVCVEATALNALLRQLPSDAEIRMEFEPHHLHVKSGRMRAKLATLPVEDFPVFRDLTYGDSVEIPGAKLRLALERVRGFIDHDQTRYYLSGVNLRPTPEGGTRVEGTNGKCLGVSTIDGAKLPAAIIPMRSVDEILKIIDDAPVLLRGCPVGVELQTGSVTFVSKLIDASYPEIDRVMPRTTDAWIWRVNRDAMLKVIAMATAAGSASSIGELHLSEAASHIRVEERSEKLKRDDEVTVELDDAACQFTGKACEFRIRIAELTSIIKAAGLVCEFRPNADLSWLRISDVSDPGALFVVGTYR